MWVMKLMIRHFVNNSKFALTQMTLKITENLQSFDKISITTLVDVIIGHYMIGRTIEHIVYLFYPQFKNY